MKSKTYSEFVKKFEAKKTTDDCYTPDNIYNTVRDWAVKEYRWENRKIERPFYPGGDYENYSYTEKSVVIDNPPFSILTRIIKFYEKHDIDYFLFAPTLTLFSAGKYAKSNIGVGISIVYDNGARVNTSFLASRGAKLRSAPDLYEAIWQVNQTNIKVKAPDKYVYPASVMTGAGLAAFSKYGVKYEEEKGVFVRRLDSQKDYKKSVFGGGFIVPELKAGIAKATLKQSIFVHMLDEEDSKKVWTLSEREKNLLNDE